MQVQGGFTHTGSEADGARGALDNPNPDPGSVVESHDVIFIHVHAGMELFSKG